MHPVFHHSLASHQQSMMHSSFLKTWIVSVNNMVSVIHTTAKLSVPLGVNSPHDGVTFGFVVDIMPEDQITTVAWRKAAFDETYFANIKAPDAINTLLAGVESIETFRQNTDGGKGTRNLKSRCLMYLPPKYVPMIIAKPLTIRVTWLRNARTRPTRQ